jgi:hypothetical protein
MGYHVHEIYGMDGATINFKAMVSHKGLPTGILESGDYVCDVAAWLG